FIVGGPVGDFELLLCHGTVCVVGKIRDLILQLSKSSIYSTKPLLYHRLSLLAAQILAMAFQEVRAIRMALESLVKELSREHR
ncbi:hypothetical protein HNS21_24975, partial [Escherichia coli]|nr:hypothetical protein [Escherichia coli]MCR2888760.1 hypothetical protein [Escherichia coli]MCR2908631.1 hypothetical protein [Escherichia coli]